MVKKLIPLLLLLLASTGFSQTVSRTYTESPQLDSLQAAVYAQLNIRAGGSRKITDVVVTKAINRGIIATCTDYPALEAIDTVLIGRSDTLGTLPANFNRLRKAWRLRGDTLMIPVTIINPDSIQFYKKERKSYSHEKVNPESPDLCWTHGIKLRMFPKFVGTASTIIDTIQISYYGIDRGLPEDSSVTIVAPQYINKIILYACGEISATRQNFDDAGYYYGRYGGQSATDRIEELKK